MGDEGACAVQRGPVSGSFLVPTDSTRTQRRAEALGGLPASHTGTREQAAGSWLWGHLCPLGLGSGRGLVTRGAGCRRLLRPGLLRLRQGPPHPPAQQPRSSPDGREKSRVRPPPRPAPSSGYWVQESRRHCRGGCGSGPRPWQPSRLSAAERGGSGAWEQEPPRGAGLAWRRRAQLRPFLPRRVGVLWPRWPHPPGLGDEAAIRPSAHTPVPWESQAHPRQLRNLWASVLTGTSCRGQRCDVLPRWALPDLCTSYAGRLAWGHPAPAAHSRPTCVGTHVHECVHA